MTPTRLSTLLVLFVSVFSAGIAAQTHHHTQTRIVDGRENPEQIPDSVARRLFFYNISIRPDHSSAEIAEQASKLKRIGLREPEIQVLRRELASFRSQFDAEVEIYNKQVEATGGLAPYDVAARLDGVVQDFRARLSAPLLEAVERQMRAEKTNMRMGEDTGFPGSGVVVMKSQYSSYSTNLGTETTLGSLQVGLSETLQGNASCQYLTGGNAPCPACTHTGTNTTIFSGGNVWSGTGDYAGLSDGTSLNQLSVANDGTFAATNKQGTAYLFNANASWVPIQPQPPGSVKAISAGSASGIWAAVAPTGQPAAVYMYIPPTSSSAGSWALVSPPVVKGVSIVGIHADPFAAGVAMALDSTNTAWVRYDSTTNGWGWYKVSGTVYSVGAGYGEGAALSTANSNGNVYYVSTSSASSPVFTLTQYVDPAAPTLATLLDSGGDAEGEAAGIDSAGKVWQTPGLFKPWTTLSSPPLVVAAAAIGGPNDIWIADSSNHLARFYPNSTSATSREVSNPADYINNTGSSTISNLLSGISFDFSSTVGTNCSCVGKLYNTSYSSLLRIGTSNYIYNGNSGSECTYDLFCPNGNVAASCKISPLYYLPADGVSSCLNYLQTYNLVVGGVCTEIGTATMSNAAINCD